MQAADTFERTASYLERAEHGAASRPMLEETPQPVPTLA